MVLIKLDKTPLDVTEYLVGIDSRVKHVMKLLNVESNHVQSVGICGMGGIGKTTVATVLYNRIVSSFEGYSFLADVAEKAAQPKDLVCLQNQLLDDILKTGHEKINNISRGRMVIKQRLCAKKILLILDNVNKKQQLDALVGSNWFGPGSRIIITTRDKHILEVFQVDEIYWLEEMDANESLKLFSKHAFGRDNPLKGYTELSKNMVKISGGLPLALEVLGSSLFGKGLEEWKSMVKNFGKFSLDEVQQTLKISYDCLDDEEQDMFLDVACFFIGMDKELAINIWEGCNFSSRKRLNDLVRKSLVKIGDKNELRMHDQLRDMGKKIIRQECRKEPWMRSRLWIHEEVLDVLEKPMGTIKVEGLLLKFDKKGSGLQQVNLNTKVFASMPKLRLLQLNNAHFEGNLEHLPKNLSWLCWKGCPFESIPTNFHLEKLAVLDLSQSEIRKIWIQNKLFESLKVLNLSNCCYLTRTPDFSGLLFLERLILEGCIELVEVHESIGYLQELIILNLRWCSKLNKLPENLGTLESLEELLIDYTAIEQLHNSIGDLKNLTRLSLHGCQSLGRIPDSVWRMESLICLTLGTAQIKETPDIHVSLNKLEVLHIERLFNRVPDWIGNVRNLKRLCINGSIITELPDVVGSLEKLEKLDVSNCRKLVKLPSSMRKLRHLRHFNMEETGILKLPNDFGLLLSLEELEMAFCLEFEGFPENFGSLAQLRILHAQYSSKLSVLPTSFSELCSLKELNARCCKLLEDAIPRDFGKLSKLETLDLSCNEFYTLPSSIGGLSQLKRFNIENCSRLVFLPELPSSLIEINAKECTSMRYFPNLSNLTNLQELRLSNCPNLLTIHGLERLESLKGLYMSGCLAFEIKRETLLQGVFEHLSYFTLPGSNIPEWFTHQAPTCEVSRHSAGEISRVILCIVLMLTESIPADWYPFDASNNTIYIETEVWRKGNVVFRSQTSMDGFRCSGQDQIYVCHFQDEHDDFVSVLKGGDQISVSKIFIPKFKGIQMKKCGFHMVYKPSKGLESHNEDTQPSVYHKLVDFFTPLDVGGDSSNQSDREIVALMIEKGKLKVTATDVGISPNFPIYRGRAASVLQSIPTTSVTPFFDGQRAIDTPTPSKAARSYRFPTGSF